MYLLCKVCFCLLCIFLVCVFSFPSLFRFSNHSKSSQACCLCWDVYTLKKPDASQLTTRPPSPHPLCTLLGRVSNPRQLKQVDDVHFVNGRSISLRHVTFLSAIVNVTSQLPGDSWRFEKVGRSRYLYGPTPLVYWFMSKLILYTIWWKSEKHM